jgi:hypothetical protein
MTTPEEIKTAVFKAGYDQCHVTECNCSVTVYASPNLVDSKTGHYKLGDILRGLGITVYDHTIWIDTEICNGRKK